MKGLTMKPKDQGRAAAWLVVLVLVAYAVYVLRPAWTQLVSNRGEYTALHEEVVRGQQRAERLLAFTRRVSALKNEVSVLEQRLSGGNQLLLFLQDAEAAASRAGVKLDQIAPGQPRSEQEVIRQPVAVQATGSLTAIRRFVGGLESTPYPVRLDSIQLEKDAEEPGQVFATVGVVLYSLGRAGEAK